MNIHPFSIDENATDDTTLCVDTPCGTVYIDLEHRGIKLSVFSLATDNPIDNAVFEAVVPHELINDGKVSDSTRMPVPGGYIEVTTDGSYYFRFSHDDNPKSEESAEVVMWDAQEFRDDTEVYPAVLEAIRIAATLGMQGLATHLGK